MELTIERRNLKYSRDINREYLISNETALFEIDEQGISNDKNIKDIPMEDTEKWKVLEDVDKCKDAYCYIKFNTINDSHKQFKKNIITHIIADEIVINPSVFNYIFKIFIRQEADTLNNILLIRNERYKFKRDSIDVANKAAEHICCLFAEYTAECICEKYTFKSTYSLPYL